MPPTIGLSGAVHKGPPAMLGGWHGFILVLALVNPPAMAALIPQATCGGNRPMTFDQTGDAPAAPGYRKIL